MLDQIKKELKKVLWRSIEHWVIRYTISEDKEKYLTIEYHDRNTYTPSKDWHTWKTLCSTPLFVRKWELELWYEYVNKYPSIDKLIDWIVFILVDKMLSYSQDVNWILDEYILTKK